MDHQPLNPDSEQPFLPKEQSDVLFWFSFLIGFTSIYAFYKKKYDAFVISLIVFLTSLNHWRRPVFGFRRNMDLVAVLSGFVYISVRAILLKIVSPIFWLCCVAVMLLLPFGWYVQEQGYIWEATYLHCLLHLCGNTAVLLFCGIQLM